MAVPTIDPATDILGFTQYESPSLALSATNSPLYWTASGLPPGWSIDSPSAYGATGDETTDVVTATGHDFEDGDQVYFSALTGGSGLTANTIYYVRDAATNTFKLAETLSGAAINFTTAITAATVKKVSSGIISGQLTTAGKFHAAVRAWNGDGSSAAFEIFIGIDPAAGSPNDDILDLYVDTITRKVSLQDPATGGGVQQEASSIPAGISGVPDPIFSVKIRDVKMLRIHFRKGSTVLDLTLTDLQFTLKEFRSEPKELVIGDTFEQPSGEKYFLLPIDLTGDDIIAAITNYTGRNRQNAFLAPSEIEWRRSVTFDSSPLTLINSTETFSVKVDVDLDRS